MLREALAAGLWRYLYYKIIIYRPKAGWACGDIYIIGP